MTHKKLRRLAALTSALLAANSAVGVFTPCYAESDFTAYAAESTEIAQEEYGVRISKTSDEMRQYYEFGDKLDLTGIEISGYYNTFDENGKLIKSTDFLNKDLQEMIDNGTVTLDTGDFYTNFVSGTRKITINYGTASTYFDVNVENEKEECSFVIDELPIKTDYILGEELDLTGAKVSVFYTDGEHLFEFKNADLQELIDDGTITIDTDDFYHYGQKSGPRSIDIWYFNRYTSFSVNVIDPYEGYCMDLISPPDKLTYNLGEELDLTGARFSAICRLTGLHGDIFPSDVADYVKKGILKLDDSEFDNTQPGTYTINLILGHDSLYPDTVSFEVTVTDEYIMRHSVNIEKSNHSLDTYQIMFNDFELNDLYENYIISGSNWLEDKDGNAYDKTEFENKPLLEMIENENVTAELSKVYHGTNPSTGKDCIERKLRVDYGDSWDILIFGMSNIEEQPSIEWEKQPQKTVYNYGEELDLSDAVVRLFDAENKDSEGVTGKLSDLIEDGTVQINADNFYNCTEGKCTIFLGYNDGYIEYDVEVLPEVPDGDANGDGKLTIADMVMVQKHIMGKKSAALSDWKCADLYEDGKIDVYDFIVMRENFVEKMK